MKKILNGIAALAVCFFFTNCSGNTSSQGASVPSGDDSKTSTADMKFAFVEIDTLLIQYNFWNDLNEAMIKREEDVRATLNNRVKELEKDAKDFQFKLENNGYPTRERAEQENQRLLKKQQEIQDLHFDIFLCIENTCFVKSFMRFLRAKNPQIKTVLFLWDTYKTQQEDRKDYRLLFVKFSSSGLRVVFDRHLMVYDYGL